MLFATWRPTSCHPGISFAFAAHLHGRDLLVERPAEPDEVVPPDGSLARGAAMPVQGSHVCGGAATITPGTPHWHWQVACPNGRVLAEGDAPNRSAAEEAAEDEVEAIHPPSEDLIEALLG